MLCGPRDPRIDERKLVMNEHAVVGLAGDWHGNTRWAVSCLKMFSDADIKTVYQVGDFGLWPGARGAAYLSYVLGACEKLGMTLWIVPGNHEDYDQIVDPEDPEGGTERQVLGSGDGWEVAVLPRGYGWEFGGRKFVALGGAPSIDYQMRTEGASWWPAEMIRESDLERLPRSEGADVMLTHDAPDGGTEAVQKIINTPPHLSMWSESGLRYAREGRMLMNRAVEIVKPAVFVHGHMHVTDHRLDEESNRLYVAMGADGELGNVAVLHLDTEMWIERLQENA